MKARVVKVLLVVSVLVFLVGCPELLQKSFALTTNTEGKGSVVSEPDAEEYARGDEVTLTAVPDEGWEFSHWSGDLTGSENPKTVVMDSDKAVTANFNVVDMTGKWLGTISVDFNGTDELEVGFYITNQSNGDFFGAFVVYFDFSGPMSHENAFDPLRMGQGFDITGEIDEDANVLISVYEKFEEEWQGTEFELIFEIAFTGTLEGDTMSGDMELRATEKEDGQVVDEEIFEGTWTATRES